MDFSVMFFSCLSSGNTNQGYQEILQISKAADELDFSAVWVPERHFHEFGGLSPNPAVLAAAIASTTAKVGIRAGSIVTPLHDPLRIAEEWAMVDGLSGGRAGVALAAGWNPLDFVLSPERFSTRREVTAEAIRTIRRLWNRGSVTRRAGDEREVETITWPPPVNGDLPIWITSSGSPASVELAATSGANLLTHLVDQDVGSLAASIDAYRSRFKGRGRGYVTVMLHTFLAESSAIARSTASCALRKYLYSAAELEQNALGGQNNSDRDIQDELIGLAVARYLQPPSLIGDPAQCAEAIRTLSGIGVDEAACLVDFGVSIDEVLASMALLGKLKTSLHHDAQIAV